MSEPRLAPFPDELLDPARKSDAIGFLLSLGIPTRYRAQHLGRWAAYVGVELEREDYMAVGRRLPSTL